MGKVLFFHKLSEASRVQRRDPHEELSFACIKVSRENLSLIMSVGVDISERLLFSPSGSLLTPFCFRETMHGDDSLCDDRPRSRPVWYLARDWETLTIEGRSRCSTVVPRGVSLDLGRGRIREGRIQRIGLPGRGIEHDLEAR
jgi:hypothetical protein